MGFNNLSKYTESMLPEAGHATEYTLCENISNYLPYDISGASEAVTAELNKIESIKKDTTSTINSSVNNLDEDWGEKFISLDGKGMDFVQPSKMKKILTGISGDSDEEAKKCIEIIKKIESRLDEVNEYIEKLQKNLEDYKKAVSDLNAAKSSANSAMNQLNRAKNSENPDYNTINSLRSSLSQMQSKVTELSTKVKSYELAKISEPDGQWIVR